MFITSHSHFQLHSHTRTHTHVHVRTCSSIDAYSFKFIVQLCHCHKFPHHHPAPSTPARPEAPCARLPATKPCCCNALLLLLRSSGRALLRCDCACKQHASVNDFPFAFFMWQMNASGWLVGCMPLRMLTGDCGIYIQCLLIALLPFQLLL